MFYFPCRSILVMISQTRSIKSNDIVYSKFVVISKIVNSTFVIEKKVYVHGTFDSPF